MQIRCSGQGLSINEQRHREPGNLHAFHLIVDCRVVVAAASPTRLLQVQCIPAHSSRLQPSLGSSGNKGDGERELHRYVIDYLTVDGRQPYNPVGLVILLNRAS